MSLRSKKVTESEAAASVIDDSTLWQEWSDAVLNKENWAVPTSGVDNLFLDTEPFQLPSSLVPYEWIRAKNLEDLTEPLTVFVSDTDYTDLITNNKHLLHNEFTRWFVSALINLEYCGRNGLEVSGENGNFIWNGRYQSWHGWMNVYSMNKAGKGAQHRPVINRSGKYIVRLYFLGSWRRIVVDDMIPVNEEGLPLLPRTVNNFELWPMLLSKALLKICCLTWTKRHDVVDFHPVSCLTGWVCLRLDIAYLSPQDKWDFLRKYADHFEWKAEDMEMEIEDKGGRMSKDTMGSRKSKDTTETRKSDTGRSRKSKDTFQTKKTELAQKLKTLNNPQPVILFLGLEDLKELPSELMPQVPSYWGHFIYIEQSRDIPLNPRDVKPPLARWKLYRWLRWAIHEGIIDPEEYFTPIRSLKVVSPLKKYKESVINYYNSGNLEQNFQEEDINDQFDTPLGTASMERNPEDMGFWADFNKMEPDVRDVHFFYKLDHFEYTVNLSDRFVTKQVNDLKSEMKNSKKSSPARTLKEPEFLNMYNWPQKMSLTRNEPLYILVDSLEDKFFLVNFSTCQIVENYPEDDFIPVQSADTDYLTIEKHNWFHKTESSCLLSILTAGTKAVVLELEPGRHLLQVYCCSESNCHVTISSDTMFQVGDKRKMYQLMSSESQMIEQWTNNVSNCISNVFQSFGTENYTEALRAYYRSYLPPKEDPNRRNKLLCDQIHDYFLDEKVQLLKKTMPEKEIPEVMRSLRILFLNPLIGLDRFNSISKLLESLQNLNELQDPEYREVNLEHQAAAIIQSFLKMLIIRKYKQIHDPQHPSHRTVLENLLKVSGLFNYSKRESLANQLLRNLVKHHDKLKSVYPFSRDLEHTLQVQEINGTLMNVKPNQWLPIMRLVVNSQPSEMVLAGIDMFVALPKYSVRVFNNDTRREMLRVVNNVASTCYHYSVLGYTIICYGWSKDLSFKELPWTLNVITMKEQPVFYTMDMETPLSVTTVPPPLLVEEFSNIYVPNSKNFISKLIVQVTKPSIVSFRLETSFENVKIKFAVIDERERVVAKMISTSVVILPMVYLGLESESSQCSVDKEFENGHDNDEDFVEEKNESRESLGYRTYRVQATVLDDSWPLTKSEWIVVMGVREGTTVSDIRTRLSSVSQVSRVFKSESSKLRRGSRLSNLEGQSLESPYWVLQVVSDYGSGLEISQDKTKELEIAKMKEAWAKENPDSLERGRQLREAFLAKHQIKSDYSITSLRKRNFARRSRLLCAMNYYTPEVTMMEPESRTLLAPSVLRRLPSLDLTVYEVKEDEEDMPWIKTTEDEEMLRSSRTMNIIYAQEDQVHFKEDMQELLKTSTSQYREFFSEYKNVFWEDRMLLEDVYEDRNSYIDDMKTVRATPSKNASSDKSKKSK